jgi:hypothetical protein
MPHIVKGDAPEARGESLCSVSSANQPSSPATLISLLSCASDVCLMLLTTTNSADTMDTNSGDDSVTTELVSGSLKIFTSSLNSWFNCMCFFSAASPCVSQHCEIQCPIDESRRQKAQRANSTKNPQRGNHMIEWLETVRQR